MPSPFETFTQRFGGRPLGAYNPFGAANQYASPYTPGAFQPIPATGTPQTQTPPGGQGAAPGQGGGGGGRENEPGRGEGGMPFGHSAIDMGAGDELLGIGGLLAGGIPGLLTGAVNSGIRANNVDYRNNVLGGLGTEGLSPGQMAGGVAGLNQYGEGHGLLNSGGVNIGGNNYGVSLGGADPTQGGGVIDGRTTLTVDEAQKRYNTLGPAAPSGLLSAPPAAPAKKAGPSAAEIEKAKIDLAKSMGTTIKSSTAISPNSPLGKMMASVEASMKSGANAKTASDLARSGLGMQQGKSGVSGSQIKGGRTVGNNPNDRSGRNPGAPRDAGAGGRLGGGV